MRLSILISILLITNIIYGQLSFVDDINIPVENYNQNFKQINAIVAKNYSHLKNKNIDIDSLYSFYQNKISEIANKEDYFKCLLTYFSKLKNSHTTIHLRDYGIKASVKMIENRLFLHKVDDADFVKLGVKKNDEILQIDNRPIIEWLNIQRKFVSASTLDGELNNTLWKVFNSEFKISRTYTIKTTNGLKTIAKKLNIPTEYSYSFPNNITKSNGRKLNETTGYITINSMTGNVVKEFEASFNSLMHLPNLIIDLRENTGGNSIFSEQIARYLISYPTRACVSRKKIKPKKNRYKGKLYVLIGVKTASAGESFAIDLLESGNVKLIGSPTAGDTGNNPKNFTTDYGISFRIPIRKPPQISFNGFPMEGTGLPPHFEINQTVEDFKSDTDTVLEYTLNYIAKIKG
ncbi:S41 family peptidase [Winogradskyella haliclonae]|uniref:Tail specific protease domain-containing protein n=1 Tax=Winogradskyella haliclonae TaxID=2048558 RepID=A0ABQ2BZR3_9FLAO|nr:S41 family peptidase [Winogradskyella haliclonae]GGI57609.1 hypothetical protein GCM10011444_19180 [Winogradskyella haliclonae]